MFLEKRQAKSVKDDMALENKDTIFPGFGEELDIRGSVPVLYDPTVTGFRAAFTTDYAVVAQFNPTINTVTGAGNVSGQHYVEFIFSSNLSGTIQNSLFLGSTKAGYAFPLLQNSTYGTISYNIPSGSAQLISF